jgi:hypothetical protein
VRRRGQYLRESLTAQFGVEEPMPDLRGASRPGTTKALKIVIRSDREAFLLSGGQGLLIPALVCSLGKGLDGRLADAERERPTRSSGDELADAFWIGPDL